MNWTGTMTHSRRLKLLLGLETEERFAELSVLNDAERRELRSHWQLWARRDQLPPAGDWRVWLILAGRGFGKTRAGAEWVRTLANADPAARIALVSSSLGEARAVMVEGESGVLAVSPPDRAPRSKARCGGWSGPMVRRPCSIRRANRNHCAGHNIATPAGQSQKEAFVNEAHALTDALIHCAIEGTAAAPPGSPVDGDNWLVGASPTGAWAGQPGKLACRQARDWLFVSPKDGMRLLDKSTGQERRYSAGWLAPAAPADPAGGATIDAEARAAIASLIAALRTAGVFPAS